MNLPTTAAGETPLPGLRLVRRPRLLSTGEGLGRSRRCRPRRLYPSAYSPPRRRRRRPSLVPRVLLGAACAEGNFGGRAPCEIA